MDGQRWAVGIDLGTTNCAMARCPLNPAARTNRRAQSGPAVVDTPTMVPIPQLVAAHMRQEQPLLPSFIHLPSDHETPSSPYCGLLARERSGENPERSIHSAKSWLSASSVDRRAPILPWRSQADCRRLSPVDASSFLLTHLRHAFDDWALAAGSGPLASQELVVTVPASFDAIARELTVEAIGAAHLPRFTLLEEPLAAFYAWLAANRSSWRSRLRHRRLVLVCDVGGGTTDFSLIAITHDDGVVVPERVAVGDHLLAGGDNMDRLLALEVEERLTTKRGHLDPLRFAQLIAACRDAKEQLLVEKGPERLPITVLGRGSSLVGSSMTTELSSQDVQSLILDTFFPHTTVAEARTAPGRRAGLVELGLPYAADPAVTRNLARFLAAHDPAATGFPDAILFNGGALRPQAIRDRIRHVVRSWRREAGLDDQEVRDLSGDDLDCAVARGAAVYAASRVGDGIRVAASLRRAYYVGVARSYDVSTEGQPSPADDNDAVAAVCVVPPSAREGDSFSLSEPELEAVVGRPVQFDMYQSSQGHDELGAITTTTRADLIPLPPLRSVVEPYPECLPGDRVPVRVSSRLNEVGTLSLALERPDGRHRFELVFQLREAESEPKPSKPSTPTGEVSVDDRRLDRARKAIHTAFSSSADGKVSQPRRLAKALEKILGRRRRSWPLGLCRDLWTAVDEATRGRRRSAEHEESWYTLAGYTLRPGFGAPLDEWRIGQTLPLLTAGLQHKRVAPVRIAWWVFWRRVAGGLGPAEHHSLFEQIAAHVLPGHGHLRKGPQPEPQEFSEMLRLAASLEGVDPRYKASLGDHLLQLLERKDPPRGALWAVARLGARIPFSPRAHAVMPSDQAADWLERVLDLPWYDDPAGVQALVALARRTDDRHLDVPDELRRRAIRALNDRSVAAERIRPLEETVIPGDEDRAAAFGEELPAGLILPTIPAAQIGGSDVGTG